MLKGCETFPFYDSLRRHLRGMGDVEVRFVEDACCFEGQHPHQIKAGFRFRRPLDDVDEEGWSWSSGSSCSINAFC
jgi:hypothetical protein